MTAETIALFRGKQIRKTIFNNEWWFVVVDVVAALTDSVNPTDYLNKIRRRDPELAKGYGQFVHPLSIETSGGKQLLSCANTEGIFRIIQSIPSPKAEPFKRWLAKVGYERVQEIDDPELATKRTRALYKLKGYSDAWIEKRLRGIVFRDELTDEWQKRGVKAQRGYEILTAEISKATFDVTPNEYKKLKGLESQNLRDHMDDLELIFTMLGEKVTTEISQNEAPDTMVKHRKVARRGGGVAGTARKQTEQELGRSVVSKENYLKIPESQERLQSK